MKKIIIPLILCLFFSGAMLAADNQELDSIRIQYKLPALGAASIYHGKVTTYISGVRKWGDQTLATKQDDFHLGSDTKAMTATLIAMFVERGLLNWDNTLSELFPGLPMNAQYRDVTLKMLTAHRSGITGDLPNFENGKLWEKMWDPNLDPVDGRKMVAHEILTHKPASTPGSQYEYSNANYIIAGAILEKISGKSWEQLIQDEIFVPLDMRSCGFGAAGNPDASIPDQPWPHNEDAHYHPVPLKPDFYGDNPPTLGPAGTVHCSMADWSKFLKMHINGFNGKNTKLLKASSFKVLHTAYPGQTYTPGGWIREPRDWANGPTLSHVGTNLSNYAVVWLAPKINTGYLSVTNIGGDNADQGTDAAIQWLIHQK